MQIPLLDLKLQHHSIRDEIYSQIDEVLESQQFILGPKVEQFENRIRELCGTKFAVGMSSGTDAQLAVLMAMGIGPGDAIITTPYTFFATAGCIARLGARPVFIDIDRATYNLCPKALAHYLEKVAKRKGADSDTALYAPTGERIRAIIPVHLFGLCADMKTIAELGKRYQLPILEDSSQAIGASYLDANDSSHSAGCYATSSAGWFSFFPSKNLGAYGDGGMVVGNDPVLEKKLRALRMHGMVEQYYHSYVGGNFRLDALQAAVLYAKLPHLKSWSSQRYHNAEDYHHLFEEAGLTKQNAVTLPGVSSKHCYHQFVIRVAGEKRDALRSYLLDKGIGNAIYYPLPLHLQECFQDLGYKEHDLPEAEKAAKQTLALPIYPELTHEQRVIIVDRIADFLL